MMSAWSIDEDTLIALVVAGLAVACLALAIRGFRAGRVGVGAAWSVGAVLFGFVAWFFATFTMRLF
jgi:hypothetical protein